MLFLCVKSFADNTIALTKPPKQVVEFAPDSVALVLGIGLRPGNRVSGIETKETIWDA